MSELVMIDFEDNGYFTYPNPIETIAHDKGLNNDSMSWLHVFAETHEGNFESIIRLFEYFPKIKSPRLRKTFAELLGDAGSIPCIDFIRLKIKDTENPLSVSSTLLFASVIAEVGMLSDIPLLLETYLKLRQHKDSDIIPIWISDLMESDPDEFCEPSAYINIKDYSTNVMNHYTTLVAELGSAEVYIFEGALFDVNKLAQLMIKRLISDDFLPEYRQRFEASTGINCSDFYKAGLLQPLNAAAILENFIDDPGSARFKEGVRYFFGHRIT